jgi:hypothetical protein
MFVQYVQHTSQNALIKSQWKIENFMLNYASFVLNSSSLIDRLIYVNLLQYYRKRICVRVCMYVYAFYYIRNKYKV